MLAGFWWVTSQANWSVRALTTPLFRAALHWSEPETVHGAGLGPDEQNNIDIYHAAKTATVYITSTTVHRDFWYQQVASQSLGSGFLVNEEGFILTDDLALIKIEPKRKLPFLRLGDSDRLQVGQKVLAIGNPFGLEGTLTVGVVSSIGRAIQSENSANLQGMIQTDAAINGGNSGGPLITSDGNVVGINTAILGETNMGIGFALPINRAKALLSDFQAGRVTERPRVGARTEYVAGDLAEALQLPKRGGLLVQTVVRGSSEAAAGVRGANDVVIVGNSELGVGGDFIIAIDGQPVDREDALVRAYSRKKVGDVIHLSIYRGGRSIDVPMKLLRPPPDLE